MAWFDRPTNSDDTLFALCSGSLPSAVAIVRLSGPASFNIANKIFVGKERDQVRRDRAMLFGSCYDAQGNKFDEVMLLTFVGPHSFTGEDVIEFQCHGSIGIVEKLCARLVELGARAATKGEFSYRALVHGKMDPEELERLADLFAAKDAGAVEAIYSRRSEPMEKFFEGIRDRLIGIQAILDTSVDFADEYSQVSLQAKGPINQVICDCSMVIQRYGMVQQGVALPRIVIAGLPNAGKSSLFNALLGRHRALVHSSPGTTRDVVEEEVHVGGRRWVLADTAGIRLAEQDIEQEGIELGEKYLQASHFWILVVDGTIGVTVEDQALLEKYSDTPHLIVFNKSDLPQWRAGNGIGVSAKSAKGLDELTAALSDALVVDDSFPMPAKRQVQILETTVEQLGHMLEELDGNVPPEYVAEKNRRIIGELAQLMGSVDTEQVLDRVFGEFCIGK